MPRIRQMTEQEFQPGSGIHPTVEVPGVRARWTIQHSYPRTCLQGHTHSDVRADMEPRLPGNSESAWRAAVQPLVLAALQRSFALPPTSGEPATTVLSTTTPKHTRLSRRTASWDLFYPEP